MSRVCWRLVAFISRWLEPDEREAVLGDLMESAAGGIRALSDVLGLVIRRQVALWKDWRPWLALVWIGPAARALSFASVGLLGSYDLYAWIAWNHRDIDPAILRETHLSLAPGIFWTLGDSVQIRCAAWATAFVIGALSRRTIWINGTIFCALVLVLSLFGGAGFSIRTRILQAFVLIPSLLGLRVGARVSNRRMVWWLLWAAAILDAIGGYEVLWWAIRPRWYPEIVFLVRFVPLLYLLASSNWRNLFRSTSKESIA